MPIVAFVTHPEYEKDKVNEAWQQIYSISDHCVEHVTRVQFDSWNPIGRDEPKWVKWKTSRMHLAHIVKVQ